MWRKCSPPIYGIILLMEYRLRNTLLTLGLMFIVLCAVIIMRLGPFPDGKRILISTQSYQYVLNIEGESRAFCVIEVKCKQYAPFTTVAYYTYPSSENEPKEDETAQERDASFTIKKSTNKLVGFLEKHAINLFGIWMTQFYIVLCDDGNIGVLDTKPSLTDKSCIETLISLVSFGPPQKPIIWKQRDGRWHAPTYIAIPIAHGFDDSTGQQVLSVSVAGKE